MLKKRIIIKTSYSALILLLFTVAEAADDQIYVLMVADARARLSGGGIITMDKDDCFQFIGYDSSQKLVHLRVDQFTFWTSKDNVQFVAKADTASAAEKCAADAKKFLAARQVVIQRRHQREREAADAERNKKDPKKVADTFVSGLVASGSVKSARYLTTAPPLGGATVVVYYMDYITQAGFRREGTYRVILNQTREGIYYVIDFAP